MLTKNELKYYTSLLKKKYRGTENKFIVEGKKVLKEALSSDYKCEIICATHQFAETDPDFIKFLSAHQVRLEIIKINEYEKLSDTKTPPGVCGVFLIGKDAKSTIPAGPIVVLLDEISDPGNVGTIIRTCDWFGIDEIVLSPNCADVYNSKVVRSTMGSLFHIKSIRYGNLSDEITEYKKAGYKTVIADLSGTNIYNYKRAEKIAIIFSSESHGPTKELLELADERVTIPGKGSAESLNVAGAAAVILSELTR